MLQSAVLPLLCSLSSRPTLWRIRLALVASPKGSQCGKATVQCILTATVNQRITIVWISLAIQCQPRPDVTLTYTQRKNDNNKPVCDH